mmetsp:Transcript_48514/g.150125  ORF Transcript_48514/g.150125 Transcript_48514/m.150125 type:complete len:242 (-) Transcript_48514:1406-2131(-)
MGQQLHGSTPDFPIGVFQMLLRDGKGTHITGQEKQAQSREEGAPRTCGRALERLRDGRDRALVAPLRRLPEAGQRRSPHAPLAVLQAPEHRSHHGGIASAAGLQQGGQRRLPQARVGLLQPLAHRCNGSFVALLANAPQHPQSNQREVGPGSPGERSRPGAPQGLLRRVQTAANGGDGDRVPALGDLLQNGERQAPDVRVGRVQAKKHPSRQSPSAAEAGPRLVVARGLGPHLHGRVGVQR